MSKDTITCWVTPLTFSWTKLIEITLLPDLGNVRHVCTVARPCRFLQGLLGGMISPLCPPHAFHPTVSNCSAKWKFLTNKMMTTQARQTKAWYSPALSQTC